MHALNLLFWNVENLFHPSSGGPRYDLTPTEGWTLAHYENKLKRVGETLSTMLGRMDDPDSPKVVGLCEVESQRVLSDLKRYLPDSLQSVIDPTFEESYADVVMLYDTRTLDLLSARYRPTFERYARGDVMQADFRIKATGVTFTVFACHLKSRHGGRLSTDLYRQAVCDNLQTLIWKMHEGDTIKNLVRKNKDPDAVLPDCLNLDKNIILMGDFNDDPYSPSLMEYLKASFDSEHVKRQKNINAVTLYNCAWEQLVSETPGTLYYRFSDISKWTFLDQMILSPAILRGQSGLQYEKKSFQVIRDLSADESGKPLSTLTYDLEGKVT